MRIAIWGPANARTARQPAGVVTEADLDLDCGVAVGPRLSCFTGCFRTSFGGNRPVDLNRLEASGAEQAPYRRLGSPAGQIPQRQVDCGQSLGQHGLLGAAGQTILDWHCITIAIQDRSTVLERRGHVSC
jgi:hypothetical protein